MQYELSNPSDPYTFIADNREVATLTVFALSNAYGATAQSGDCDNDGVPIFLFGGAAEWYGDTFGRTPDEGWTALQAEVANALSSFMYGSFEDRRRYDAALNAITDDDKRNVFIDEWQDGRTSLNNIGGYAHRLAEKILARLTLEGQAADTATTAMGRG